LKDIIYLNGTVIATGIYIDFSSPSYTTGYMLSLDTVSFTNHTLVGTKANAVVPSVSYGPASGKNDRLVMFARDRHMVDGRHIGFIFGII